MLDMTMDRFSDAYQAAQKVVKDEKYPPDWCDVITKAKALLAGPDGPDPAKEMALSELRKKLLNEGKNASELIVAASREAAVINPRRAATLKMLKHLYLAGKTGDQTLWVYSPPKAYTKWVYDEIEGQSETAMQAKLGDEDELYTTDQRKVMADAVQHAARACGKVQAELGIKPGASEVDAKTVALVRKWFFGDAVPAKNDMDAAVTKLRNGFRDIAVACSNGKLIFSDDPVYRAKPGKWQNFALIKTNEEMMVVYMMKGFLDAAGKPTVAERWLCVETIIHELSHKIIKTDDYVYDFHGLKPGSDKFPAGAGLDNADSWGYFACEVSGILPPADEVSAYRMPTRVLKVWGK